MKKNRYLEYLSKDFFTTALRLKKQGTLKIKIISGSMEPIIMTDEIIEIIPLIGEPKRFDILIVHQDNIFICHYFWRKNNMINNNDKNYLTRALKSQISDIPFQKSQILGIVKNKKLNALRKVYIYLKEFF